MPKMESTVASAPNPEIDLVLGAAHPDPFGFLGMHCEKSGLVIRVFNPRAQQVYLKPDSAEDPGLELELVHPDGFFEGRISDRAEKFPYQLKWVDKSGNEHGPERDVFDFGPVLGDQDLHFLGEGSDRELWKKLGGNPATMNGVDGFSFAVWAPNARRVSIVGDFNNWDGRIHPMRKRLEGGIWEIFLPGIEAGAHYKFEIVGEDGSLFKKSDPLAFFSQHGTSTASITCRLDTYNWQDEEWMNHRADADLYHGPVSIYEVHLGSWKRRVEEGNRFLSYLEFADELVDYVVDMGFTHIELMPVSEFPFDGSWGYQVCGYFAPTSRFGTPDEFRAFVDRCHRKGIGVLVDWVPAHFPKDPHGLARFDGTALYEHADPKKGEHMDWGTLIFNYGRNEVRNFLIANALYWLEEFHIDGLRVDAVASMLYLDYSREHGQWIPNQFGGRENLEAIDFVKELNSTCYERHPGIMMIAEESTAFPGVSRPIDTGGLGFGFKWNMGWMNDFLEFMSKDPIHRQHHHNEATFSMIYAYHENYMLVLSHDEVVHGKGSLIGKMPGDEWQQRANLRFFLAWMYSHPGKKLLFQGAEIAQGKEWDHGESLDWHLLENPAHAGIQTLVRDLNRLYADETALNELDHDPAGFEWIDHLDSENSLFSFVRKGRGASDLTLVVVNATPVPRQEHRVGLTAPGVYRQIFNSDAEVYGGSNIGTGGSPVSSEPIGWNSREHSIQIQLPPLATVFYRLES
ncbi:MAG: 1,4-alpha-glucan branching protein GlgB [Verrucomicrobiales bacterium]|nr:1,4-alpha-glucan branching protein GlgB [Verrucomicrobiales bacterium]